MMNVSKSVKDISCEPMATVQTSMTWFDLQLNDAGRLEWCDFCDKKKSFTSIPKYGRTVNAICFLKPFTIFHVLQTS